MIQGHYHDTSNAPNGKLYDLERFKFNLGHSRIKLWRVEPL